MIRPAIDMESSGVEVYRVPDGATTTSMSCDVPPPYKQQISESVAARTSARVGGVIGKYRKVLEQLSPQPRAGDPSYLLVELAESERRIIEAERLTR